MATCCPACRGKKQCTDCKNRVRRERDQRVRNNGLKVSKVGRPPKGGFYDKYLSVVEEDAVEFGQAIEKFKRDTHTRFPSWSEVLSVLKSLGYAKVSVK